MTQPVTSGNSDASNLNQINNLMRDVQKMQEVQIFKDESGTRRVLLGRGANGFYGFKVSQEGYDVTDATNAQLSFTSDNNVFKIVGKVTINYDAASATRNTLGIGGGLSQHTYTHGLGRTPAYFAFVDIGSTGSPYPAPATIVTQNGGGTAFQYASVDVFVDGTTITVENSARIINTAASNASLTSQAGTVTVYLLEESALSS